MTAQHVPSGPGVIEAGFQYQFLIAFMQALRLRDGSATLVRVEVSDAGNVDDVVVHPDSGPAIFRQVKYTVDASTAMTHEWMMEASGKGRSLLKKFYDSYVGLKSATGEPPDMRLVTTRPIDPGDPLLRKIDMRTGTLTPRINDARPGTATGRARQAWIDHLGVTGEELLEMLDNLAFEVAQPAYEHMVEQCGTAMRAVGLEGEADSVNAGVDAVRQRVIKGLRNIELADLEEIILDAGLEPAPTTATLMVQAIDHRDSADMATASVDWVELFEGDEPGTRRRLRDPTLWNSKLRPELQAAVKQVRADNQKTVAVDGAMRLSVFFLAGRELSSVSGFNILHNARGVEWASRPTSAEMDLTVTGHDIGAGDDIAVGLSVTGDITDDLLEFVHDATLPVSRMVNIAPASGPARDALTPENAPEWAEATIAAMQRASRGHAKIHLFLYAPGPAALLLGHAWNRLIPVQVYEELGPGARGYTPTFFIPG